MTNNNLFIHIESGNIFYQNFNTNEMCSFLLAQQDKTKKLYQKRIAYHHSFETYFKGTRHLRAERNWEEGQTVPDGKKLYME